MQGQRVYEVVDGDLVFQASIYGKDKRGRWVGVTPNGHYGDFSAHDVVEHEDGTITVAPSILVGDGGRFNEDKVEKQPWHGYLERGIWREC